MDTVASQKDFIKTAESFNEHNLILKQEGGDSINNGAKPINQIYHWSSRSKYTACLLTSAEMKNRAFALLYQEYVANAKTPWDFQSDNPSNIRVEKRLVDGRKDVPVLVDDFEHNSHVVGLFTESKKLVGTIRLLLRDDMHDGKLEVERYDTLPPKMKDAIETRCNSELNRLALDRSLMKGKKVGLFLTHAILAEKFGHGTFIASSTKDIFYSIQQGFHQRINRNRFNLGLMIHDYLGAFKYEEKDPYPVDCFINSSRGVALTALFYSLAGGAIPTGIGMMPYYNRMKMDSASLLRSFMMVMAFLILFVLLVLRDSFHHGTSAAGGLLSDYPPVLIHLMVLGTLSTFMLQSSSSRSSCVEK